MIGKFWILANLTVLAPSVALGREPTWQEQQNLPAWVAPILGQKNFTSTYALTTRINPYFLQGDFNGDGRLDLAVLIQHRTNAQQGIAIVHAGASTVLVVGAGRALGNGGADFNWMDAWSISAPRPDSHGDTLLVQKLESAGGVIYWDGKAYQWRQQGD